MNPSNSIQSPSYEQVHQLRFDLSLKWLESHAGPDKDVLELGGASAFSTKLSGKCKSLTLYGDDLRKPLELRDGSWDIVLCMEVLEHIADTDGMHTEWQGDGAMILLRESFRVLKPGGILFLTTPNAASITAVHHALRLAPPMIYRPHVREYAPYELDELVRSAGFAIERRETIDVWRNAITAAEHEAIRQFIYHRGYPVDLRGEDIFLIARKPFLET
jgi:SAM-dependent methyltransferase